MSIQLKRNHVRKSLISGAVSGGILGVVVGFLDTIGVLAIPRFAGLAVIPFSEVVTGTVMGIFIGGSIGGLIGLLILGQSTISEQIIYDNDHEIKLQLREEQLDITKKLVQTGEVTMHKEFVKEEKNILVPTTREELVIEKKTLNTKNPDNLEEHTEVIRIPISTEQVEVNKRPVLLNDVSVHERQFQETKHVEETVKKEKGHLKIKGDPKVIDNDSQG